MEEEIMTSRISPNEGGVIQHEPNNKAEDENGSSLSMEDLQGPQEVLEGNPSTSPLADQTDGPFKMDQRNNSRLTPIAMNLEDVSEQPQLLQQPEGAGKTLATTPCSNYFLKDEDSVNEQKPTNEPADESGSEILMASLQNMMNALDQVAKPGEQSKAERGASQVSRSLVSSTETNKCAPNMLIISQSQVLCAMTISGSQNVERDDQKPLPPNEQTEKNQNMLMQLNPNDNHVPHSTAKCVSSELSSSSSTGEHQMVRDIEQQTQHSEQSNSTQLPQVIATAKTSSAEAPISTISNTDYLEQNDEIHVGHIRSPSKSNQEPFLNTSHITHPTTSELFHAAETLRTAAPKFKENDTANAHLLPAGELLPTNFQLECFHSNNRNLSDPTENQPHNMRYLNNPAELMPVSKINSLHVSRKRNSTDDGYYQGLVSNRIDSQMPKNGLLQPTTTILIDDDDEQYDHTRNNDAETMQSDSSTKLKRLDSWISVLHPPVKAPTALGESLIRLDNRNRNKRKFNFDGATKNSKAPRSDFEAGLMLSHLLEKRSVKNAMTLDDLNEAILEGKPIPPMMYIIDVESKRKTRSTEPEENQGDQQASGAVTQKTSWITGSHHLKKYLCWPCLLFGEIVWYIPITLGLGDIVEAAKNHQNTAAHMSAFVKFLVHEAPLKREQEAQLEKDLECRRLSLLLLRLLIEITSSNMNGTPEDHAELLSLACSYKTDLQEFIKAKSANFLVDFVATNLSLILGAIERFLMATILEEIKNVPFVSIIFEETTDVVDKSLIAVIFRYATDSGVPKERFVKLIKMGMSRTVADFLKNINLVVQEYQLTEKLVGFTYSGTVISPKEILIFNKTVNRIYPKARFFPYQEHNFKKIITQSLSHIAELRNFFYSINELAGFLENAPNAMKTLIAIEKVDSEEQKHQWDFSNDFINTIKYHYTSIMAFFHQVLEQELDWDSVTVMQVKYFSRFLSSLNCRVLVLVISAILGAINDLCTAMESDVDIDSWNRLLSEATNTLSNMKKFGLSKIVQENNTLIAASEYVEFPDVQSSIAPELYGQIIDTSLLTMNHRCVDMELAFVGPRYIEAASNCETDRLPIFLQRINFSHENFAELKNEAKSFFENPLLADMSLEQSVKHIYESKMVDSARNLLRFLQLCLTLPSKGTHSSNSRPAVLRLRSYIAKNKPLKFFDLLIFMEKCTLSSMQQEEQFYDYIIEYCAHDDA